MLNGPAITPDEPSSDGAIREPEGATSPARFLGTEAVAAPCSELTESERRAYQRELHQYCLQEVCMWALRELRGRMTKDRQLY